MCVWRLDEWEVASPLNECRFCCSFLVWPSVCAAAVAVQVQHFASTLTPRPPLQDAWQLCDSGPGRVGFHTAAGAPIVNTSRFPDLGAMASHAHSLNLTAGWYGK